MEHFFFYTNNNSLHSHFCRNQIACNKLIPNNYEGQNIGTLTNGFVFITHRKLDESSRTSGIKDSLGTYPIALEFDFRSCSSVPAVLMNKGSESPDCRYTWGSLSEYDRENDDGAFLIGELPLSTLVGIYFNNEEHKERFFRITPDYWAPEKLFKLVDESFDDPWSPSPDEDAIIDVLPKEDAFEHIIAIAERRNKYRAAIHNFATATRNWIEGKYTVSFDCELMKLFDVPIETIQTAFKASCTDYETTSVESILPDMFNDKAEDDFSQSVCNKLIDKFQGISITEKMIPSDFKKVFDEVIDAMPESANPTGLRYILDEILSVGLHRSKLGIKGLSDTIDKKYSELAFLKGLIYVVLNPQDYTILLQSLIDSKADCATARYACTFMGYLCGLRGYPGKDYFKDNMTLWNYVEWKAAKLVPSDYLYALNRPETDYENKALCGIPVKCERRITFDEPCGIPVKSERNITFEELYKLFSSNDDTAEEIMEHVVNVIEKINEPKFGIDKYKLSDISKMRKYLNSIKENLSTEDYIKTVEERLKHIKSGLNKEAIKKDWINCKKRFAKVDLKKHDELVKVYQQIKTRVR